MNSATRFLSGLAAAGLMAGVSAPAHAVLQIAGDVNGITFFCADNTACDTNGAVGVLELANGTFNGVSVNGSISTSTGTPGSPGIDLINTSSLSVINGSGSTKVVTVAVSDTDFSAPVASFDVTGSGTWIKALGSSVTLKWYDDPENVQGADNAFDAPGDLLHTFSSSGTLLLHSFSDDFSGPVDDTDPFSMTIWAQATLTPGANLLSRGQGEIKLAIPEPSTWAMMLLGFAGLSYAGFRQTRKTPQFV